MCVAAGAGPGRAVIVGMARGGIVPWVHITPTHTQSHTTCIVVTAAVCGRMCAHHVLAVGGACYTCGVAVAQAGAARREAARHSALCGRHTCVSECRTWERRSEARLSGAAS